jgi:hypothetical protein
MSACSRRAAPNPSTPDCPPSPHAILFCEGFPRGERAAGRAEAIGRKRGVRGRVNRPGRSAAWEFQETFAGQDYDCAKQSGSHDKIRGLSEFEDIEYSEQCAGSEQAYYRVEVCDSIFP